MSSDAQADDQRWQSDKGGLAGCSGHGLSVAQHCVTRDYVRAEAAAASSESRRARCHLGVFSPRLSAGSLTLQHAASFIPPDDPAAGLQRSFMSK